MSSPKAVEHGAAAGRERADMQRQHDMLRHHLAASAFISAQDASCDSRTMVEIAGAEQRVLHLLHDAGEARLDDFEIDRVDGAWRWPSSRSHASRSYSSIRPRARSVPAEIDGRAIELIEDRRVRRSVSADIELLALIDRAVDRRCRRIARAASRACASSSACPAGLKRGSCDRRHAADAAHAIGHDLDRLVRRHVAEHALGAARRNLARSCVERRRVQRLRAARHGDLVALAGIAHVERALDADRARAQTRRRAVRARPASRARANMRSTSLGSEVVERRQPRAACNRA